MAILVYDDIYLKHDTKFHPENFKRLTSTISYLKKQDFWNQLKHESPRRATEEEVSLVHTREHIERMKRLANAGGGYVDADTVLCRDSFEVALWAVGGVLQAVDALMQNKDKTACCLVRPPGHHATRDRAMGFCIFNNVAIAAKYLIEKYKLSRVLIIDWDVHHGNGTQDIFYSDPSVMFFSLHRYPFYPGTGARDEIGSGAGKGTTLNSPLPYDTSRNDYLKIFQRILENDLAKFKPEFVLVSAGFDAYRHDPVGGLDLLPQDYKTMTALVVKLAGESAQGRVVSALEGGYHIEDLPKCIAEHIEGLLE